MHRKLGLSPLGTVHETVLGHLQAKKTFPIPKAWGTPDQPQESLLGSGSRPSSLKGRVKTLKGMITNLLWAAANGGVTNGGVTNGGLRGVWPPFPEIGRNRPFSPFFCLFRPFSEGAKSTWEIQKTEEKGLFPQISSDFLKPPSLKPPFAALQLLGLGAPKSHNRNR